MRLLRTRIPLLAGVILLLALVLSDGLTLRICRSTMLDQAAVQAREESQAVFQEFGRYLESVGYRGTSDRLPKESIGYFFRARRDDYTIVTVDGELVYNQTKLTATDLDQLRILRDADGRTWADALLYGRRLMAFTEDRGSYAVTHLCDVTDVYLGFYRLAGQVVLISLAVLALAVALMFLVLRRSLRPLGTLSQGAKAISEGAYNQRVPEDRPDEIGALGGDFNRMAQAVERHVRQVEDSEEKKTLFMGALAHELKTPLTAISGYAQTLQSVKLAPEDRDMALGAIVSESRRLDRLSKKMLRLLELEQDEEPLVMENVPVRELFAGAVQSCAPAAAQKGVTLEIGEAQGELTADRDLMNEVFINLADNAIKASSPGGTVRLYTDGSTMIVEDQGAGIPAQEIDKLTEPFYMVDKSRSRKSGGAGLGLALTAAILKRHGLALHIESEPGKGTQVSVFPA